MILPIDTQPESSLYFFGAKVLEVLNEQPENKGYFFDVFNLVKKRVKISLKLYQLTLDWLFLINIAKVNEEGVVYIVHKQT
ncbi:hypothetical protein JMJ99_09840 [Companilactobacillus zhachilii]|uniref:ABC-three component system middle component 6 n=1 Tax=Companilactobacillus zhachilii TaxID=2304606 RepID=UPI00192239B3|nr:ABC-three component system middle component 6 [Companilactobacillus zhachilii]MBL3531667.1 hypothetical protein [Companilactobacillus zhachilii]